MPIKTTPVISLNSFLKHHAVIGTIELNVGLDHILGDKCFDTQEKSIPHNKVQKTHNKVKKTHNKVQKHTNRKH